jgi:hypothetical protein
MTSEAFKKYLGPKEMERVISKVVEIVHMDGVALCGGAAMQVYGSDRLTKDVDFLSFEVPSLLKNRKRLTFGGSGGTVDGVPTDFIVRDDDYKDLYEAALTTAKFDRSAGCRVVRASYLAAMKLAARRDKDELDLKTLIENDVLPLRETRAIINEHLGRYAMDEFNSYELEMRLMGRRK